VPTSIENGAGAIRCNSFRNAVWLPNAARARRKRAAPDIQAGTRGGREETGGGGGGGAEGVGEGGKHRRRGRRRAETRGEDKLKIKIPFET